MPPLCKPVILGTVFLAASACAAPKSSDLTARATGEWTRSYPIEPGGELQVFNGDGPVTVDATDGASVEVRAERTVYALTEDSARDVLGRLEIREETDPMRVVIRAQPLGGIVIGVRVEVAFHVRAPRTVTLRTRSGRGGVNIHGFSGRVFVNSVNGPLTATGLSGGLEARVMNGAVKVSMAALGDSVVDIRSVNGPIDLVIPETAKANVQANAVNGRFEVAGLNFVAMNDNTQRRFRGRINDGGTPLELSVTNGRIRIASPAAPAASDPAPPDEPLAPKP